jgi:hypothetical protein
MRYVVALLIAGLVIAVTAVFSWRNYDTIERSVRQHPREQKERGDLPPELQGVDLETLDLSNYKVRVPDDVMSRQNAARLLAASWYVWAPLAVGVSIGMAALVGRWRGYANRAAATDRPRG